MRVRRRPVEPSELERLRGLLDAVAGAPELLVEWARHGEPFHGLVGIVKARVVLLTGETVVSAAQDPVEAVYHLARRLAARRRGLLGSTFPILADDLDDHPELGAEARVGLAVARQRAAEQEARAHLTELEALRGAVREHRLARGEAADPVDERLYGWLPR